MLTPPMSRDVQPLSAFPLPVGRLMGAIGATVADGWFAGEESGLSWDMAGDLMAFGLVMGMADFWCERAAIALALAR